MGIQKGTKGSTGSATHRAISAQAALISHEATCGLRNHSSMGSSASSRMNHILWNGHVCSADTLIITTTNVKSGGASPNVKGCILAISTHPSPLGVLALHPEQCPGAAFFRALPEYAVVVTASPSAVTPVRVAPLVSRADWSPDC